MADSQVREPLPGSRSPDALPHHRAVEVGFEPTDELPHHTLSRRARHRPPLVPAVRDVLISSRLGQTRTVPGGGE